MDGRRQGGVRLGGHKQLLCRGRVGTEDSSGWEQVGAVWVLQEDRSGQTYRTEGGTK